MKKFFICFLFIFVILTGCSLRQNGQAIVDSEQMRPRPIDAINFSNSIEVVENVSPAVVGIYSQNYTSGSIGTGVAIEKGGYVLTNSHVITTDSVTLHLADGKTTTANLVYRDSGLDLAIVKSKIDLPYLTVASIGDYEVGEDVLAIGTPLSLQFKHTVTKGIISAKNRTIKVDGTNGSTLNNLIQHDASINPGNSGGPLINLKGQVIGINTVKVEDAEGLGFAIPVETITPIFSKLSSNKEVKTAFLGFTGFDASIRSNNGNTTGVYVYDVLKNSTLDKLGIKKGDIITSLNGINIDNMLTLRKVLNSLNIGDEVEIVYIKDNFENIGKIKLCEKCNKL